MKRYMHGELAPDVAKRANDKLQLDPNAKITQGATASDGSDAKGKSKSGVDKSIFSMAEQRDY
jgi:hypothetical protein